MAPLWGVMIGLAAAVIYWPGIVSLLPGLGGYYHVRPFRSLDLWLGDHLHPIFAQRSNPPGTPTICIVGITEECVEKYGEMPWDRDLHARLVKRLHDSGVRTVAFDIYFPAAGDGDDAFVRACREANNVILPRWAYMSDSQPLDGKARGAGPAELIPLGGARAARSADGVFRAPLRQAAEHIYGGARGHGHINVFYDNDALTRRVPVAVGERGRQEYYIPLGVMAALPSLGVSPESVVVQHDRLLCGDIEIPLDPSGCIPINFCEPIGRYVDETPVEIQRLKGDVAWLADKREQLPMRFVSYSDVLEGRVPAELLRGNVALVGQRIRGSREDVHVTPYGSEFGVMVQAMVLHTALTKRFLHPVSPLATAGLVLALSTVLGTVCFSLRFRRSTFEVVGGGGLLTGLGVLVILCVVGLLRRKGLMLNAMPFLMAVGFNLMAAMAVAACTMTREAERRNMDIDMLLRAGRKQISRWVDEEYSDTGLIEGAQSIAMSASLSVRSPEIVAETFLQTVPSEGCVLLLLGDGDGISFERAVFVGFPEDTDANALERVAKHFAREVVESGEPVLRPQIDETWALTKGVPGLREFLGVPLLAQRRPSAVVLLFNKQESPEDGFTRNDLRLADILRYQATVLLENARRYRHEYAMFDGFAQSLAKAVDFRDNYTHGHSQRVAEYSVGIARDMNLSEAEIEIVQRAATLHDLGKVGVSDEVLNKPGKLSDEEFAMIQAHASNGFEILKEAPSFEALLPGIRSHHERYDGRGYPDGMKGEDIPLLARIIAAADAYDAMTSDRIYRKALPMEKAKEEMKKCAGTQFDPEVVEAFLIYLARREVMGEPGEPAPVGARDLDAMMAALFAKT